MHPATVDDKASRNAETNMKTGVKGEPEDKFETDKLCMNLKAVQKQLQEWHKNGEPKTVDMKTGVKG